MLALLIKAAVIWACAFAAFAIALAVGVFVEELVPRYRYWKACRAWRRLSEEVEELRRDLFKAELEQPVKVTRLSKRVGGRR